MVGSGPRLKNLPKSEVFCYNKETRKQKNAYQRFNDHKSYHGSAVYAGQ